MVQHGLLVRCCRPPDGPDELLVYEVGDLSNHAADGGLAGAVHVANAVVERARCQESDGRGRLTYRNRRINMLNSNINVVKVHVDELCWSKFLNAHMKMEVARYFLKIYFNH